MSDEIFFDGQRFVSAGEASSSAGFTRDYIARLCRDGRVRGRRIGKNWYVEEESLKRFLIEQEGAKAHRREQLSEDRAKEYHLGRTGGDPTEHVKQRAVSIRVERYENASESEGGSFKSPVTGTFAKHAQMAREKAIAHGEKAIRYAPSLIASPTGLHEAVARTIGHTSIHVPTYTITPFAEFIQKLTALVVAFTMTFGTYALVDPTYAKFAINSMRESVARVSETYVRVTGGGSAALAKRTRETALYATENPSDALASASSAALGFIPNSIRSLARAINSGVDDFVYAIAFPQSLTDSESKTPYDRGSVEIEVAPYARGVQNVSSSAAIAQTSAAQSSAPIVQNSNSNPVTVVERRVETERIVSAVGGITEEYLNKRLSTLESQITSRLLGASSANVGGYTTINNNYQMIAQTNNIDKLGGVTIDGNSTFSGGTITGSSIDNATITGSSFAGSVSATTLSASGTSSLATTTVTGDLTVTGDAEITGTLTIPGALTISSSTISLLTNTYATTSLLSAVTASTTNLTWVNATGTNATTTNFFSTNASTTNATSTNFFASVGHITSGIIDTLTSYSIITAPSVNATSTTATSTFAGGAVFSRAPSVAHTFSSWAIGASNSALYDAALVINPVSAIADGNLISASVNGSVKFLVDAEGDVFVNNLTSVGSVTLSTTTASTFTVEGNTTFGDAVSDVSTVNGTLTVTGTTTVATTQGNFGVGTTTPWGRLSVAGVAGATTPLFTISSSTSGFSTSTALIVDSNGWVGIGTSSPSKQFAVASPIYVAGSGATATSTFDGNVQVSGLLKVGTSSTYISNSDISTIGSLTVTSATTTNLFSTTASSTNLYSTSAQFGALTVLGALTQTGLGTFQSGFVSQASSTVVGAFTVTGNSSVGGTFGVGVTSNDASAAFQVDSTSKGLLAPRMTTAQKNAIASPAAGLTLYDSSLNKLNVYNGTAWKNVGSTEIGGEVTSGTQGSVLFIGDGTVLAQDNANFTFSTSTNRLLVTQASSTRLSVFSNAYFGGTATTTISSTGAITTPANFTLSGSSANIVLGSNYLSGDGGDEGIYVNSTGQVGIGQGSPDNALDVVGNFEVAASASASKSYRFRTNGSALDFDAAGADMVVSVFSGNSYTGTQRYYLGLESDSHLANTHGTWRFLAGNSGYDTGSPAFVVDAATGGTGNVGIGATTSPWAKLSISANSGETNQNLFLISSSTASATSTLFAVSNTGSTTIASALNVGGAATLSSTLNVSGNTTLANATTTNLFSTTASSTNLYSTSAQFGALTVLGALTQTGLGTFQNGFVSQASSTIVGAFTNTGAATFGSTLAASGLATLSSGFVSQASSTVAGAFTATGAAALGSALNVSGLSTFNGLVSTASSTIGDGTASGGLTVAGTATTTNLRVTALTSGRVPYVTTSSQLTDSANLTFDGTTLTAANLTSSGNVTLGNATSTNLFSTTASSTNLYSTSAQFGALTVLGALTQTGLGTFQNGFVSQASSTIVGAFTNTGAATFGSTLAAAGLATLTSGFVSQASSTVAGDFTTTGRVFLADGSAALPTITFTNNNTSGISNSSGSVVISSAGVTRLTVGSAISTGGTLNSTNSAGFALLNQSSASVSSPTMIPNRSDTTTGFASGVSGNINAIVGGSELMRWTSNAVAIGTSTPWGKLTINADNGTTQPYNNLFLISSSTATASTTLFSINNAGLATIYGGSISQASSTVVGAFTNTGAAIFGSTLAASGLTTLTSGFVSQASSTVVGNFTTTGNTLVNGYATTTGSNGNFATAGTLSAAGAATLSSTLGVTGLSTLSSGFVSQASSTIVGAGTITGAATFGSTLAASGLATLASGHISQASSTVVGAFTTTGTNTFGGVITSTASTANTLPYASSTAITVSGTGYFGTASSSVFYAYPGSASAPGYSFSGTTNAGMFLSGSNLAFTTGGSERLTLTSGGLLGVGTTTPFWALTVASSTGPQLALTDGTATSNAWTFRNIGNTFYLATSTASATSTTAALSINGNSGAATFGSPATTTFTGGVQATALNITSTTATSTFANGIQLTAGCFLLPSGSCAGTGGGGSTVSPVAFRVTRGGVATTTTDSVATILDWTTEDFDTNSNFDLTTERFTPTVAGKYLLTFQFRCNVSTGYCGAHIFKNGSQVGQSYMTITDAAPTAAFTVIVDMNGSTDYVDARAYIANASPSVHGSTGLTFFTGSLLAYGGSDPVGANGNIQFNYGGVMSASSTLTWDTTNKRFGIGTTSPFAKLAVHALNGETNPLLFEIASSTASATSSLFAVTNTGNVGVASSTPWAKFSVNYDDANETAPRFFVGSSTAANFIVDATGNVGIGTSTLDANPIFTVAKSGGVGYPSLSAAEIAVFANAAGTNSNLLILSDRAAYGQLLFGDQDSKSSGNISYNHSADSLVFNTVGANRLTIDSSGNVGIGTTSPLAKLSVQATAGQTAPVFEVASSSNAIPFFTITSSGSVGIGTSSPSTKLEVVNTSSGATADAAYLTNFASATSTASRLTFRTADVTGSATSTSAITSILQQNFNTGKGDLAFSTLQSGTLTEVFRATSGGNLGIGTTTPLRKFAVEAAVSAAQLAIGYDTTRVTEIQTDSSGDVVINPSGDDVRINDDNLWVCTGGSCPSGTPSGNGNLIVESKIGIGSSTPMDLLSISGTPTPRVRLNDSGGSTFQLLFDNSDAYIDLSKVGADFYVRTSNAATLDKTPLTILQNGNIGVGSTTPTDMLSVAGLLRVGANSVAPVTMGTATSTFNGDIKIVGKLDVSTIDPVYTIDGIKYATYGHSTVGIKEETMQTITLEESARGEYSYTIDFDELEKGSDLWLFYQITDFGADWKNLVVSLTPSFEGVVHYEKNVPANTLTIVGDQPGEVSMRLVGSRYDFSKWPNLRTDQDGDTRGTHVISGKQ